MSAQAFSVEHISMQAQIGVEHIYQGGRGRRKEKKRKTTYPLFISAMDRVMPKQLVYDVPESIYYIIKNSDLPESVKQQAYYFSHLVFRGPKNESNDYTKKNRGKAVHLSSKALDDVMRSKKKVFGLLIPKYIKQSRSYQAGVRSKSYAYKPNVELRPRSIAITDQKLIQKICIGHERGWKRQIEQHSHRRTFQKLFDDVSEVSAPLRAIGAFVVEIEKAIESKAARESLELMLNRLLDGRFNWKLGPNGRLYTSIANYPEAVRAEFLLAFYPLVEIDLSNSHPALLTLFAHDEEEKERLANLTSTSQFYAAFGHLWEFDREKVWGEGEAGCRSFKQLIQKIINGPPRTDLRTYRELCEEFPRLMATIAAYKSKAGWSGFADKLQGYEAQLICSIVDRLGEVPCFTAYDGIAVPAYMREDAEGFFKQETERLLGFALKTKVKIEPSKTHLTIEAA
jgi:hypothetical protein